MELNAAEQDRKDTSKAHSDNIKRIKAEMKELIEQEEEDVSSSQKNIDE
jgi:gas vesicle protein